MIAATISDDGRPTNPVVLARSESASSYEAVVVTPEQMIVILNELDGPETRLEWTLALVHAATALRPEEAFGLKWADIDWKKGQINIRRGWSKGKETPGKNKGSMTQVAMHPALALAVQAWRRESLYHRESDWVFASARSKGKTPRSAGVAGQDYLRPAAVKAGVIPKDYKGRFGWHNLRHSLATFYLILDPDSAAFVLLNPTIELLAKIHPRLPATFFRHFVGSLNRWVRVYDYHDAEERVDLLREWYEGEENPEQYEVPDIEGCTPQCLKERSLGLRGLKDLNQRMRSKEVQVLVSSLLELWSISRQAKRPEFTDDMREQLMDSNPPLPCLLAAFSSGDAVVGCFDDEAQTAMETTPQPNLIVPLKLSDPTSVRQGFRTLAVACETLAAASRLIDRMPGNDDGVITDEGQS